MRLKRAAAAVGVVVLAGALGAQAGQLEDGINLYNAGKFAEAEAALRGAEGPEAGAYLAAALAKQKKYGDAEAPARAALEADPASDVAAGALGEALVGQKKYDVAIDQLSAALKKKELPHAYFWRAQAYDKKDQAARMVADYQAFVKLAPKAPEAASVQALLAALK
jgi:tetratricopeptide (TPR) repeat protein